MVYDGCCKHGKVEFAFVCPTAFEIPLHEVYFDADFLAVAFVFDHPVAWGLAVVNGERVGFVTQGTRSDGLAKGLCVWIIGPFGHFDIDAVFGVALKEGAIWAHFPKGFF